MMLWPSAGTKLIAVCEANVVEIEIMRDVHVGGITEMSIFLKM